MIRRQQSASEALPMDSLLDILSNLVGMLVFLIVVAVISSAGIRIVLNTFLRRPESTKPVYFVCRAGKIVSIDPASVLEQLRELREELKESGDTPGVQELLWEANRSEIGSDSNYHVEFVREVRMGKEGQRVDIGMRYYPQEPKQGPHVADLEGQESQFRRSLNSMPAKGLAYFFVYPDGIEVFDVARNMARKRQFEVGWRAMLPDQTVGFSGFAGELFIIAE